MPSPPAPTDDERRSARAEVWLAAGDERLQPSPDLWRVAHLVAMSDVGPGQAPVRVAMHDFADAHRDALLRTCAPGHFTGSALVLDCRGEKALFLFHTKLQRWLQPGGHADGDANLAAVARREAEEETGIEGLVVDVQPIDFDIHRVAAPNEPEHLHLDVRFLVAAPPDAVVAGNHESEALRWVSDVEAEALDLDEGTVRLLRAARARWSARPAPFG